jgi:hypothetical protein
MSEKTTKTTLRDKAEAAIEAWRAAEQVYRDASAACPPSPGNNYECDPRKAEQELAHIAGSISVVEAFAAESNARAEASAAVAAAEIAEGDGLAIAASPAALRDALAACCEDEARLQAEIVAVRQRADERIREAHAASVALAGRRRAEGLPEPVGLPSVVGGTFMPGAAPDTSTRGWISRLDAAMSAVRQPNDARAEVACLRIREEAIRADIERRLQEEEREAARLAAWKADRDRQIADLHRSNQERNRQVDLIAAQERAALAEAHRKRTARGAS